MLRGRAGAERPREACRVDRQAVQAWVPGTLIGLIQHACMQAGSHCGFKMGGHRRQVWRDGAKTARRILAEVQTKSLTWTEEFGPFTTANGALVVGMVQRSEFARGLTFKP